MKGSWNSERLSAYKWWILALHVLLLPEFGCEIYGPYKGSSSCVWQTVYILQDRRSWLLMPCEIATEFTLWITRQGICLHVGWYVDLKALLLAWNCNMYALVFLYFYFPPLTSITLSLSWTWVLEITAHLFKIPWPIPPCTNIFFRVLSYQLLQSLTNSTCINIRFYSMQQGASQERNMFSCIMFTLLLAHLFTLFCFIHVLYWSSSPIIQS